MATATSAANALDSSISFGPGSVDVLDPTVGLDALASYHAVLTLEFAGTRAGVPEAWQVVRDLSVSRDPSVRILTTTQTGTAPSSRQRVEIGRSRYERHELEPCQTSIIDADSADPQQPDGRDFVADAEPAAWLPSLRGADDAGSEAVGGILAEHATFDERALGSLDPATALGEIWTAVDGGQVLRLHIESVGGAAFLGRETTGTLAMDYTLDAIGSPVTTDVPMGCELGVINVPFPDDAQGVELLPGRVEYGTSLVPADVIALYEQQLGAAGWVPDGEPMHAPTGTIRAFVRGGEAFAVVARTADGHTRVTLTQDRGLTDQAG